MKQKKSSNTPHPEGGTIDPELDANLADLVKKGIIEKFVMNGQVIYGITPYGDKVAEELIRRERNKSPKLP